MCTGPRKAPQDNDQQWTRSTTGAGGEPSAWAALEQALLEAARRDVAIELAATAAAPS